MKEKRRLLKMVVGAVVIFSLCAWTIPAIPMTIRVLTDQRNEAGHRNVLIKLKEIFEARNPDIKIQYYGKSHKYVWQQILTEILAGNPADVINVRALSFQTYGAIKGGYEPLNKYLEGTNWNDPETGLLPPGIEAWTIDGKIRGIGYMLTAFGLYIWRDMFEEAGIDTNPDHGELATWEGLRVACRKLSVDTDGDGLIDRYGYATCDDGEESKGVNEWEHYAWTLGGGMFPEDQGPYTVENIAVNNEGSVEALELLADLEKEGYSPPGVQGNVMAVQLYCSRRAGMLLSGGWTVKSIQEVVGDKFQDVDVIPIPGKIWNGEYRRATTNMAYRAYCIPAGAKHKEAAGKFLRFFASDEAQEIMLESGAGPAKLYVLNKLMKMEKIPPELELTKKFTLLNLGYNIIPVHTNPQKEEMYTAIGIPFAKAIAGKLTPKDALDLAYTYMANILAKK